MTTGTSTVSVDALDAAIAAATGDLAGDEQRLAVAVFRLLSAGEPVSVRAAAAAAGTRNHRPGRCCGPGPRCSGTARTG